MKENSVRSRLGGIPVNRFAFAILLIVAVLHSIIIALIIDVNHSSTQLAELMQCSGKYQMEAVGMLESTMVFSETCGNYMQVPALADGSANVGPLVAYAEQLENTNGAAEVIERFKSYNVSGEVLSFIKEAAECADKMSDIQLHAISLMRSVYPTPPIPQLAVLPEIPLIPEELAMSADERVAVARRLILDKDYSSLRYHITDSIDNCNLTLQQEFDRAAADAERHVAKVRALLWASVFLIILVLSGTFVMFYELIVKPVRRYSEEIDKNKSIEQVKAITELHRLVNAHNKQWNRRNKLEAILRAAAETDTLTGLPNRYSMERDLIENEGFKGSVGVLLFDINFLKKTNDTKGHMAGDRLIRTAADCIRECFGAKNANNCYRIGGDEFVAILTDCSEDEINRRIEHFKMALEREDVTVSVGYAYSEAADFSKVKELMEKADKHMYDDKRIFHREYTAAAGADA